MCGIAGYVGLTDKVLLKDMCDIQQHRGPDAEGYFLDQGVGLGNRRLSIIDLQNGDQPIHNEDETIWATFNGEIYNYIELREHLTERGHRFYTESDTEVLLHSYEEHGPDFVTSLRGMYAFALWDMTLGKLLLARDRLGKKPLYYAEVAGCFLFSSEAKGILQYDEIVPTPDLKAIGHFLTFGYVPSPWTAFQGIRKVPPACVLTYANRHAKVTPYWKLSFTPLGREGKEDDLIGALGTTLTEATRLRLRSDVPLGAFLSGGIDSSTVVSLASRLTTSPLKTFSIGFENESYNELPFAARVASFVGADHHELMVRPDAFEVLPTLAWHYDEPFADASAIPTYYVSQLARRHVKVVLTGDGGDEMFMGYPWMPDPIFGFPTNMRIRLRRLKPRHSSFEDRYLSRVSRFSSNELEQAYSHNEVSTKVIEENREYMCNRFLEARVEGHAETDIDRADYVTIKGYMTDDILVKVDRASMAVSLEARCPLLDHVLCEYAAKLPTKLKMDGVQRKIILKQYAAREKLVPDEVLERPKQGFGTPLETWFVGEIRGVLEQLLLSHESWVQTFIKNSYITNLMNTSRTAASAQRLFSLAMLELWYRMFIGRAANASPKLELDAYL